MIDKVIQPASGQEFVWDYPRPPRLERTARRLQVRFNGVWLADTTRALRVLETSHPPVYYFPPEDVRMEYLLPEQGSSYCEWKGQARYYGVQVGERRAAHAAWTYSDPPPIYAAMQYFIAFYPRLMDVCLVDGEAAQPQPGAFYGGWITADVVGPFKGEAGTERW